MKDMNESAYMSMVVAVMFDALRGITNDYKNGGQLTVLPVNPKPAKEIWDEIVGGEGQPDLVGESEGLSFLRHYLFGGSGIGIGLENDLGITPEDVMAQYLEQRSLPPDTDIRLSLMMIIKEVSESLDEVLDFMRQLTADISDLPDVD